MAGESNKCKKAPRPRSEARKEMMRAHTLALKEKRRERHFRAHPNDTTKVGFAGVKRHLHECDICHQKFNDAGKVVFRLLEIPKEEDLRLTSCHCCDRALFGNGQGKHIYFSNDIDLSKYLSVHPRKSLRKHNA